MKKVIGIVILIGGIVCLGISYYIKGQVLQGQEEISSAKQKVGTMNKVFSLTPQTDQIGQQITKSANQKIAVGEDEVADYTRLANALHTWGILLVVLGGAITAYFFWKGSQGR